MADFQPVGQGKRPVASPAPQVIATLTAPGGEPAVVLVTKNEDGTITLAHDYPDFEPQAGWRLVGRGLSLTLTGPRVGRTLTAE